MTRVEISLSGAVDYDVRVDDGELIIEIAALAEMDSIDGEGAEPSSDDPWAVEPLMDAEEGESVALMDEFEEATPAPATTLTGIEAQEVGEDLMIHLQGDGVVESAMTFTLEDPARLVIDLPEMVSTVETPHIALESAQASGIRIGAHPDKVRVVIDAGSTAEPFGERRVIPVASGMILALGAGDELEMTVADVMAAEPAHAPAPIEETVVASVDVPEDVEVHAEPIEDDAMGEMDEMAEMVDMAEIEETVAAVEPLAASSGSDDPIVTIYGVEFDIQDERDRVVVLSEHPVDYLIYEPDPETVVLSVQGAVIDPEAAVRIAPDPGGPVSLVTAFDQPDVSTPEVRVVVKRAANLKPVVARRGALLVMDFPRSGGMAATPPILREQSEVVAQIDLEDAPAPDAALDADGETDEMMAMSLDAAETPIPVALDESPLLEPAPAAVAPVAPPAPMPASSLALEDVPAAIDAPASIAILNEGGLMDGKEYLGRRISLDFKAVDIADVLRLIAEVSDLNVIAGDEVSGAVTIRLVDVPWDQALDVILLTKGLGFMRIGNVLRIAAADVLAQEEELRLQERRAKEKLEDLVVKLQPVNYADVADVSGMVTQLLTPRGSVNTDTRTNTLIIKDIPTVIDEATALIKAVDTMTPQVMIESKIVEAGLEFSREFGALWTFGTNPANSTLGGRDYVFQGGADDGIADGWGNQVVVGNSITSNPTGLLALAGTVLDSKFDYEVEIQAAEVNGDGKVISSPRVVTLDNSKATIEQGVSIPFQTFENGDAQLEFVDAVLKLQVTPHITSDKSIIMEIQVSRNAPDDSVFTLTGSPAIAKNQVKTETLVKDGQTLVLGGIYVVDKSERASRVPYLHKIPLIGMAFKSNEISDSRKELLIFVTPRIIQTAEAAS
jgi:type IV pilus assembly protein PilQ